MSICCEISCATFDDCEKAKYQKEALRFYNATHVCPFVDSLDAGQHFAFVRWYCLMFNVRMLALFRVLYQDRRRNGASVLYFLH